MKNWKTGIAYSLGLFFLLHSYPAAAAAPGFVDTRGPNAAGSPPFVRWVQYKGEHQSRTGVWKAREILKKIENGILYTAEHQYSLEGVAVRDLSEGKTPPDAGEKRIVVLTFQGKRLMEAVISP